MDQSATATTTYHHGGLRQALIDAGLAILNEENVLALSLRKVAKRADVSHTAPYRHFKDKSDLLAAIAEEGFRALSAEMKIAFALFPEDPRNVLLELGRRYVGFGVQHPAQLSLMFSDLLRQGVSDSLGESAFATLELVIQAITAGQRANLLKAGDPQDLARTYWALAHGLAMLSKEGLLATEDNEVDQDKITSQLENLLAGMAQ